MANIINNTARLARRALCLVTRRAPVYYDTRLWHVVNRMASDIGVY